MKCQLGCFEIMWGNKFNRSYLTRLFMGLPTNLLMTCRDSFTPRKGFQSCRVFYVKRVSRGLSLFFVEKVIWKFHSSQQKYCTSHSIEPTKKSEVFALKMTENPRAPFCLCGRWRSLICVSKQVPLRWILGLNHSDVRAKFTLSSMRIHPNSSTGPTLQGVFGVQVGQTW